MLSQKQSTEPKWDVICRRKKRIQRIKTVLKIKDRKNSIKQWMIRLAKSFQVEQKDKEENRGKHKNQKSGPRMNTM